MINEFSLNSSTAQLTKKSLFRNSFNREHSKKSLRHKMTRITFLLESVHSKISPRRDEKVEKSSKCENMISAQAKEKYSKGEQNFIKFASSFPRNFLNV